MFSDDDYFDHQDDEFEYEPFEDVEWTDPDDLDAIDLEALDLDVLDDVIDEEVSEEESEENADKSGEASSTPSIPSAPAARPVSRPPQSRSRPRHVSRPTSPRRSSSDDEQPAEPEDNLEAEPATDPDAAPAIESDAESELETDLDAAAEAVIETESDTDIEDENEDEDEAVEDEADEAAEDEEDEDDAESEAEAEVESNVEPEEESETESEDEAAPAVTISAAEVAPVEAATDEAATDEDVTGGDVTVEAAPPEPVIPPDVYCAVLALPPDISASITRLRAVGEIETMPPPSVILTPHFRTQDLDAVTTALANWVRIHMPIQLEILAIKAEIVGAQQYIAAWTVDPQEELQEAIHTLRRALADLILPMPGTTGTIGAHIMIGDHVPAHRYPHVISEMQRVFETSVWQSTDVQLVRYVPVKGPDDAPDSAADGPILWELHQQFD